MQATQTFARRLLIYQKERFPFLENGLFLTAFAFSAISYARICRGASGFVDIKAFLAAAISTICFFFLLRILDEFKDREVDAEFRPHLPVPRGLISFSELRWMGLVTLTILLLVNILLTPAMLKWLLVPLLYLFLISRDFFVSNWLNRHWEIYVFSHMFFFPAIDYYSSGMDWYLEGPGHPPFGMTFFFAVSYMNGLVWEVGRKLKAPENEEHNSYSKRYGRRKATWIWLCTITFAFGLAVVAAWYVGLGWLGVLLLAALYLSILFQGIRFLSQHTVQLSKRIELASGAWGLLMYLILGALPMLLHYF
ncbi:MAG: UbiA family prenyltransferase [Phaeodactylibacter sp.]|nr:UbiA family prenyltransferase [Phaeodactylibacter sp.]